MLDHKKALKKTLKAFGGKKWGAENVRLSEAHGRYLQGPLKAREDYPAFDGSLMDGYALRHGDTMDCGVERGKEFRVIYEVPAGARPLKKIGRNECARIFTGAMLPPGADCVIKQEAVKKTGGSIKIFAPVRRGNSVKRAGSDMKKGGAVFPAGHRMEELSAGVCAAQGITRLKVIKKPEAAVITTGNEVVRHSGRLKPGQIRDSNLPVLRGLLEDAGCRVVLEEAVKDDIGLIIKSIQKGLKHDFVVISGGISVGDYDFVREALFRCGVKEVFWKTNVKPGKPLFFGIHRERTPVFALPGNPSAAIFLFYYFIRPAILASYGAKKIFKPVVRCRLSEDYRNRTTDRFSFVRVELKNEGSLIYALPAGEQESFALRSFALCDGLLMAPPGEYTMKKGSEADVMLLRHLEV